jgi:phage gpG-like protein
MAKIRITRKGDFEMKRRIKEFNNLVRRGLPKIVGNEAVNFSKESFRKQGFTDGSFKKWQSRKNNKDKGRAILVKSGDLRRSIKKRVRSKRVTISSNLPYSPVHNYGRRS